MKVSNFNKLPRRGYAALFTTLTLSLAVMAFAITAFRDTQRAFQVESINQVRLDYSQKERAFLRALLHEVPNAAMRSMMENSLNDIDEYAWPAIFERALEQASVDQSLDPAQRKTLGIKARVISANTGDKPYKPADFITAPNNTGFFVLDDNSTDRPNRLTLPPRLRGGGGRRKTHPIVSFDKRPLDTDELYSELPYPEIAFGYAEQGSTFIAKRNWWAFTVNFGAGSQATTGIAPNPRTYLLSLYEVPSQLAIASSGFTTSLGKFDNGDDWDPANIDIEGNIYAKRALIEDLDQVGSVASREGIQLGNSAPGGQTIGGLAERRELQATTNNFYPYSSSSDSGMVSFTSINRGWDFFDYFATRSGNNRVAPTRWDTYSTGARQTKMRVEVGRVVANNNQMPNRLFVAARFNNDQQTRRQSCTRNAYWRFPGQDPRFQSNQVWPFSPAGDDWFIQSDILPNGRPCLTLDLEKLPNFLSLIGADDTSINNSIWIGPRYGSANVRKPAFPSANDDMALMIEKSADLSAFPDGLTIVTPLRVYFTDNFNEIPATPPSGSGITGDWYPPVSVYAPEKRFGIQDTSGSIEIVGRVGIVASDETDEVHPLDLKDGGTDSVDPNSIKVDLTPVTRLEDLAPVNSMSWMTVIEEIR